MWRRMFAVAAFLMAIAVCNFTPAQEEAQHLFDHHVHVLSPRLISDWKSLGMEFSRPDEAYMDSGRILEQNEIAGAFLISMAHLYSTEDFQIICTTKEMERRLVAAENDFVAVSVARSPADLVGFFSVNLFKDYAFDEMRRCKANPNLTGLKLHLPSCGFDLENQKHWRRLAEVLAWATGEDVPILLHLTAGEAVDLNKAMWFWESVIEAHPGLELYLAHLGSIGGFNDSSENFLMGYHRRTVENPEFRKMAIFFDLSGAIIGENSEIPATTDDRCKRLSALMLKIGTDRFLFASDYPVFPVSETRADLENRLALPAEDLAKLFSNRSRLFDSRATPLERSERLDECVPD